MPLPPVYCLRNRRRPYLVLVALLLLAVAVPAPAQSIDVYDGSDAVGLGFFSEFSSIEQFSLNGYTSFSIAGIMDIGGYLGRQTEKVNGIQGDNMSFGFVYNLLPVRQSAGAPFSVQMRLTWGLTLVNRDVVVAELRDRIDDLPALFDAGSVDGTRSGYTLGVGLSRSVPLNGHMYLRLGADAEFRTERSTYTAVFSFSDDDDSSAPRTIGFRRTVLLYVPSAAVSIRMPDGPVISFGSRFWFDEDGNVVVRPELNFSWLQYQ